jgi:hypothetical protein
MGRGEHWENGIKIGAFCGLYNFKFCYVVFFLTIIG